MFYTRTYVCFTDAILSSLAAGKPINACREIFLQQLPFYLTQKLVTSHINGMSFLITSYWKYNLWGKVHYLKIVCTWCNKYHRKSHQKILISRICGLRPILKTTPTDFQKTNLWYLHNTIRPRIPPVIRVQIFSKTRHNDMNQTYIIV